MATPFGGPLMVSPRHFASPEEGDEAGDDAQQCRLARSGAAQQADDFAGVDCEIDFFQHQQVLAAAFRKRTADATDIQQAGRFYGIEHEILSRYPRRRRRSPKA
jgi:hypothetical protein